jgi:hypothetical protein
LMFAVLGRLHCCQKGGDVALRPVQKESTVREDHDQPSTRLGGQRGE